MRLKLTLEYSGTRYSGWQIQQNARTVQGEVEKAIHEATGADRFELYGSGRTDAGVHDILDPPYERLGKGSAAPARSPKMRASPASSVASITIWFW